MPLMKTLTLGSVTYEIEGESDSTTIQTWENVTVTWATILDAWIDKAKDAISVGQSDGFKYFDKTVSEGQQFMLSSGNYWDMARVVFYDSSNNVISVVWTSSTGQEESFVEDTTYSVPSGAVKMRLQSWHDATVNVVLKQYVTKTVSSKTADSIIYTNGETVKDALDRLGDDVLNLSRLKGKKIAYNGDSICEERLTGSMANGGAYPKLIANATGCIYHNIAKGGATFATGTSASHIISTSVSDMAADADIVCFEGGINDFFANVPVGTLSDSYTSTLDTTTLTGAIESIIRQSIEKWSGVPIVWVIVHKFDTTWTSANQNGDTYQDYRDAIIAVLNKYAIPYYDCALLSGLSNQNATQRSLYMFDGEHPKESGYKMFYVPQLISLFESVLPY